MANVGRFFCVALPFLMTLVSLIALLVGGLAGVADKSIYLFQVNLTDLSVPPASLTSLIHTKRSISDLSSSSASHTLDFHHESLLNGGTTSTTSTTTNITAAGLGLADVYDVSLWGYCATAHNGTRTCITPEFNWASGRLNDTIKKLGAAAGVNVTLPQNVQDGINTFSTVTRWAEIVFIIAYAGLAVELLLGLFATCSRVLSCLTFLVAAAATVAVCGAAAIATAMAAVIVGTVESTAKWYGAKASFDDRVLVAIWLAAAFAIGASFFWLFTICCCAPDHSGRRPGGMRNLDQREKFIPSAYQQIDNPDNNGFNPRASQQQYGVPRYENSAPRSDLAYEPYSHANV